MANIPKTGIITGYSNIIGLDSMMPLITYFTSSNNESMARWPAGESKRLTDFPNTKSKNYIPEKTKIELGPDQYSFLFSKEHVVTDTNENVFKKITECYETKTNTYTGEKLSDLEIECIEMLLEQEANNEKY